MQRTDFDESRLKWRYHMYLHACQARGLGKICSQRLTKTKVFICLRWLEKVGLARVFTSNLDY